MYKEGDIVGSDKNDDVYYLHLFKHSYFWEYLITKQDLS